MLGSEATASFVCLGCHQLHLNPNDGYQRNQLKVGKPLIVATLTKNASFSSYGTFAYLLRAHIRSNWKLSLNCSKCAALQFTLSSSTPTTYLIGGQPIKLVEKHKDLGILVQNRLSWSDHITSICAKAYRSLHFIRRSISSTSSNLRFSLYLSLVRSKLS